MLGTHKIVDTGAPHWYFRIAMVDRNSTLNLDRNPMAPVTI